MTEPINTRHATARDVRPWITPPGGWNQVLDPHHLGHSTDSLTGSNRLHLDTGTPQEALATARCRGFAESVERWYGAHHPSFRFVRRLAELECRPILDRSPIKNGVPP